MRIDTSLLVRLSALATWPIGTGLLLDVIDFALGDPAQGWAWTNAAAMLLPAATIAPLCALLATHRFGAKRSLQLILAGVGVGLLGPLLIMSWVLLNTTHPMAFALRVLASGGALGGAALTSFAYIWLIRRPDRDPANPPTSTP